MFHGHEPWVAPQMSGFSATSHLGSNRISPAKSRQDWTSLGQWGSSSDHQNGYKLTMGKSGARFQH